MIKIIKKLYSVSMIPEVTIKRIFYSLPILQRFNKNKTKNSNNVAKKKIDKEILFLQIKKMNINKGDLLIVHSSMDSLRHFDITPKELIDFLIELIGKTGTLAMPAFPIYKTDILNDKKIEHLYDTRIKLCSTGILPNIFLRYPKVVRSKFPYNSLAALGPLANEMMQNNLNSDLAFGKESSWYFCKEKEAKILLLGVPSNHTTTMVHVAEDYLNDSWPIKNWYLTKKISIRDGQNIFSKTIRIRDQFWSRYNASYYRTKCFKNEGLLSEWEYEGVIFGVIGNSSKLVDFIINRALTNKLFFKIPQRYYK